MPDADSPYRGAHGSPYLPTPSRVPRTTHTAPASGPRARRARGVRPPGRARRDHDGHRARRARPRPPVRGHPLRQRGAELVPRPGRPRDARVRVHAADGRGGRRAAPRARACAAPRRRRVQPAALGRAHPARLDAARGRPRRTPPGARAHLVRPAALPAAAAAARRRPARGGGARRRVVRRRGPGRLPRRPHARPPRDPRHGRGGAARPATGGRLPGQLRGPAAARVGAARARDARRRVRGRHGRRRRGGGACRSDRRACTAQGPPVRERRARRGRAGRCRACPDRPGPRAHRALAGRAGAPPRGERAADLRRPGGAPPGPRARGPRVRRPHVRGARSRGRHDRAAGARRARSGAARGGPRQEPRAGAGPRRGRCCYDRATRPQDVVDVRAGGPSPPAGPSAPG